MKIKTAYIKDKERLKLSSFPNFSVTGSIAGMKKIYGKDALLVKCGSYIYNVGNSEYGRTIYNRAH